MPCQRGFVDQDETTGVTRSQNVVLTLPHDWGSIAHFLPAALERVDPSLPDTQLLVITADAEAATAIASAAARLPESRAAATPVVVLPATSARRAARMLRARPAVAVAGAPLELAALVAESALKLGELRMLVVAWADDIAGASPESDSALEAVLAEVPRTAIRTVVVGRMTAAADQMIERYLRRARHVGDAPAEANTDPLALQYVSVVPAARPAALRRLLDDLDPSSAAVVTRSPEDEADARDVLRSLGYPDDDPAMTVTSGAVADNTQLVILYDVPATRAALRRVVAPGVVRIVALAQPRQFAHLREIAGGPVTALTLAGAGARARTRDEALRAELRARLVKGLPSRELIALEPLLLEFDGVEVAAAALRLLEDERARALELRTAGVAAVRGAGVPVSPAAAVGVASGWTRIFVSVGERDGIRPGDLVGAISGEAGIPSDHIGKIELRDSHALVEIASAVAAQVVEKVNGMSIKGRRVAARVDKEMAPRNDGRGARSSRPDRASGPGAGASSRGDRAARPPGGRGADRGARSSAGPRAERGGGPPGARPDRPPRPDRGAAPGRGPRDDAGPPRARGPLTESEQWADRGERIRHARRPRPGGE